MIRTWVAGAAAGIAALAVVGGAGGVAMGSGSVSEPTTAQQAATADIVDTAVAAGQFATLAEALQAADLVDTLRGPGPFTVFAPTDEAFAKIPAATLTALLENPAELRAVLTYHVVAGEVLAADVVGLTEATTVNGADIEIAVEDGNVVLNGTSTVVVTDILATNGVIHVIDTVLLPPAQDTPAPAPTGMLGSDEGQPATMWMLGLFVAITIAAIGAARLTVVRTRR